MTRFLLVVALIGAVAVVYLAMHRAWRERARAQAFVPAPAAFLSGDIIAGPWSGTYVGAVFSDRWLERVVAHTLGARSLVEMTLTADGINIVRPGELSFGIPKRDLIGVRADSSIAGRVYEEGGLVVLSFTAGDVALDAGFRFPSTEDHLAALAALAPEVAS